MDFLSTPYCDSIGVPITQIGGRAYEKLTTLFRSLLFSGPKLAMEALTSYVSKHVLRLVLDPSSYQESLLPSSGRIREQLPRDALNISPIGSQFLRASADRTNLGTHY